ncbi:MAG TPA: hypothetical protein VHH15_11855 [Actinophytocola sp.]|nr:hypothetical protein [Actinophytocola sp.]
MRRTRGTTRGALVGVLVVLLGLLAAGYSPPARAAALPGGKANWVAAVGGLTSGTAHRNWVRLGGNSHIRPLLQVIDDGDFRGWVGVEPFANASSPGDFHNEYWIVFELTDAA